MYIDYEKAKEAIKGARPITDYLEKSKNKLYCCPFCGSGTHGTNSTGAVEEYEGITAFCFSCSKKFDVIDIYQEQHGTDFKGAIEILANELNISLEDIEPPKREFKPKHDKNTTKEQKGAEMGAEINQEPIKEDFTEYIKECAARIEEPGAAEYLAARGISTDTAKAFNIGYDAAAEIGNNGYKAEAIIIPINESCIIRRLTNKNNVLRYNNSGNMDIFNKKSLYSPENEYIFVTEGVFDALSILELGHPAIALNSTSNIQLFIDEMTENPTAATIIILLDNDEAGAKGTPKLEQGLKVIAIPTIKASLPLKYKDANEALTDNREELEQTIKAALEKLEPDDIEQFLEKVQTEAYRPYRTGLGFFDDLLGGGLIKQTFTIVMAAPGAGKTSLCQQIAEELAKKQKQVVYLNLEMSKEQMLAKAISGHLADKGIFYSTLDILQGYRWGQRQEENIKAELAEYKKNILPYIKYNPAGTSADLEDIQRYLTALGNRSRASGTEAPVVILDYLHLVKSSKITEDKELIKQTVICLKDYAKKYDAVVIGIVATNRDSNKSGYISLESGRDSSNIEYTADNAISLNYEKVEKDEIKTPGDMAKLLQEPNRAMVLRVLKGRLCAPGRKERVIFRAANNRFYAESDFIPAEGEKNPFNKTNTNNKARKIGF